MVKYRRRRRVPWTARSMRFKPTPISIPTGVQDTYGHPTSQFISGFQYDVPKLYPDPAPDFAGPPRIYYSGNNPFAYLLLATRPSIKFTIEPPTAIPFTLEDLQIIRDSRLGGIFMGLSGDPVGYGDTYADREVVAFWRFQKTFYGSFYTGGGESLGFVGRYWQETVEERYGPWVNTTVSKHYQFMQDQTTASPVSRALFHWSDSQNGIKRQEMFSRMKWVPISHFVRSERTVQWKRHSDGGAIEVSPAQVERRWAYNYDVYKDINWTTAPFPASSFDFAAFEAAYDAPDLVTLTTMAEQWMTTAAKAIAILQNESKWHRVRFLLPQPTYSPRAHRIIGRSNPPWTVHRMNNSVDQAVTYPKGNSVDIQERTRLETMVDSDWICIGSSIQGVPPDAWTPNPNAKITAIDETKKFNRVESRRVIRTEAEPLEPRKIVEPAKWPFVGGTWLTGSIYTPVTFKIQLANVLGAEGRFGGTINSFNGDLIGTEPVEGWHDNTRPVVNAIVRNLPKGGFNTSIDIQPLVVDPNRASPAWVKPVVLDDLPNVNPGLFRAVTSGWRLFLEWRGGHTGFAGPITFSLRVWDGWEYSASIPVTINLV